MLRRSNSSRLSRRKSTSSVHSKHEPIDPAVARQHAHTAATLAFARAQEKSSADVGHSGSNLQNSTRVAPERQPLSQQTNSANAEPIIKRQHSVRFAGPDAVQRRQSIGTRAVQRPSHSSSSAGLRPIAMTTNAAVPAAYRPPSRSSSIGKASMSKATVRNLQAIAPYVEYYSNEEDAPSTPSSYRRLRRSKSMFSPLKAPSVFYTNGTPDRPESSYLGCPSGVSHSKTPQSPPRQPALRAPKSMSFLRGGRALFERNDEAVQMARDRFFQDAAQQRLREQPSFLFRSKAQRQEKPFRKSVRSSSGNSYGALASFSPGAHPSAESTLRGAARRASKTIKNKLRRVFGHSKKDTVEVPNQQIDARETHVRRYNGDLDQLHQEFSNIPHPDEAAMSRVASRVPSLHNANSSQQLRSYAGSVRSVRSARSAHSDDKSRVTSWTSTGANTMASQTPRPYGDREQQRLSIINENGTHIPSSSFTRPRLVNQFPGYPPAHRPSKSAGHIPAPGPGLVDSARVYSALMKRLDETSPKARLEASHKASIESFNVPGRQPLRSSSVSSSRGNRTPATIRHVLPEDSIGSSRSRESEQHNHQWVRADSANSARAEDVFGFTGGHVHQWVAADPLREARMRNPDDVFSPKNDVGKKENIPPLEQPIERRQLDAPTISRETSTRTSYHTVPETFGMTPQELAIRNEPVVQTAKALRESRSTFFGGTSVTIARTTSPFRRAMAEAEHPPVVATKDALQPGHASPSRSPFYLGTKAAVSVETLQNAALGSEKAYSDSIYSRTTSGQTPAAANSALSLPISHSEIPEMPMPRSSNGDVVIIDRTTYRPVMPNGGGHRITGSNGSIEWKKWMSSEVAKLERSKENAGTSYVNYALPTMPRSFHTGHVREAAQIDDEDVEIAQPKAYVAKQPLSVVQQQNPNIPIGPILKPILKNRSTISLAENSEAPNISFPAIPIPPPPPPIPVRSPLRPMPSKSSLRSVATINTSRTGSEPNSAVKISSLNGRNLLHKRNNSQVTLRSTRSASIKSIETPAKLVKRICRPLNINTPSPGGPLSAEDQSGSTSTNSRYRTPGMTNSENVKEETDDIYGTEGAGLMGPRMSTSDLEAQALGSKQMVELFLSSRRRRIAGGSEESGAVFL